MQYKLKSQIGVVKALDCKERDNRWLVTITDADVMRTSVPGG